MDIAWRCISYFLWQARASLLCWDMWPLPGAVKHQKMTLQNNLYFVRGFCLFVNITSVTNSI